MKTKTIEEKLIKALGRRKTTITASKLADKIGHPVPSVRRALVGLVREGVVHRDAGAPPHLYWMSRRLVA